MPNWCNNCLQVSGSKRNMAAFRKWLGADGFKLNKILPLPKELEGTTSPCPKPDSKEAKALVKKFGANNWYDWQCDNWGTKWDVEAEVGTDSEKLMTLSFDSAWAPPTNAIAALAKQFPKLEFRLSYCETGMCFAGVFTASGEDTDDECVEASSNKEGYRQLCLDEWDMDPFEFEEEDETP